MKNVRFHSNFLNRKGEDMKKSLILLPLVALVLAGCTTSGKGGGKKKKSSSESTSQKSSSGGPTVPPGPTPAGKADFDLTPGRHTAILDFENYPDDYTYPRAEEGDTEGKAGEFGGMHWLVFHSYKGSYEGQYWLMMKDKDNWDATSNAWFANSDDLGTIESIEVAIRTGASAKKKYDLSVGTSAFTSAQTDGTEFDINSYGRYSGTDKKGFFCVSTKKDSGNAYNGQISKLTVTYTIS